MSLQLDFEPHSWHMGFAIKQNDLEPNKDPNNAKISRWEAYTDDGMTYSIIELEADTLDGLKSEIREYHLCKHNGYGERIAARRLEQLRTELRAERISYGELAELFKLHEYIADDDVELREAAGMPENA